MFGKNRDRHLRAFAILIGVAVIISMVFSSFIYVF